MAGSDTEETVREGGGLVSAVIIFWNAERFLGEAIDSVLAQTYRDWELLLVDDGSTDGGPDIARGRAAADPGRLRYLAHPGGGNRGMSAARNLGIRHARGAFIAFLDADDVWLPPTLAEQVALLGAHPEAAMVYGAILWWYSWTGRVEDHRRDFVQAPGFAPNTLVQPPQMLIRFLRRDVAAPSGMLIRRWIIERVGGFEERFRGTYEDQAFCAKVCLVAPVLVVGGWRYRYRQHADSSAAAALETGLPEYGRLAFLRWLEQYLSTQPCTPPSVWRTLRRELWLLHHPLVHRLVKRAQRRLRRLKRRPG